MVKLTREQRVARRRLFDLLEKLEIIKDSRALSQRSFEEMMQDVLDNFGQPDQLLMDIQSGSVLTTLIEAISAQGAQNEKMVSDILSVAGVSVDGSSLPDDPSKVPGSSGSSQS